MEESEKRRERLQALRMDAASQASTPSPRPGSHTFSTPPPPPPPPAVARLSNPLAHTAPPPAAAAETTSPPPRFDFYTDPMSAYSGSKRQSGGGRGYNPPESFASPIRNPSPISHPSSNHFSAGLSNYPMAIPAHQFQVNQSPDQSPYEMSLHVPPSGSWRSPVPFASPFSGPIATPATNPGVWNRSGGSSGHGFPPNSSRGGYMSPSFGRGGSPMSNPGRGSPHSSGRGKSWRSSSSPSPGRSGGRGRGFYDHGSARQETQQHFYIKSMVKDPWRKLKPVVGRILMPLAGPGYWLPKSLTAKKVKIEESGNEFNSQSSLAECLALSFEEAINDANA